MPQSVFKAGFLRTPHFSRRPEPPWALNKDSMQADGLTVFWPLGSLSEDSVAAEKPMLLVNTSSTIVTDVDGNLVRNFVRASSQFMEFTGTPGGTGSNNTLAAWFRTDSATVDQTLLSIGDGASDVQFYRLVAAGAVGGDPVRFGVWAGASEQNADSTTGYTVGEWHHACGSSSNTGTDRKAYIDGGSVGTSTVSAFPSGLDRTDIGRTFKTTPSDYMSGQIAHACIWNRPLRAAEVWQLYDPATRWDLYYPLQRRIFSFPSEEAAAAAPKRLLLLGVG